MADSIDLIYKRLSSPRDEASFFKALGEECISIGRESKNENLTETAFYQVASTMEDLYREKKISLSTYHAIASVYQNWSHYRLEIGNTDGWKELANKGLNLALTNLDGPEEWENTYLLFLYDIYKNTDSIEERWQLLSSSFLPFESIGKFGERHGSLCRGLLLMETAFLMEKRGMGADVKSSITLIFKSAETLRYCYDNHVDSPLTDITAASALKMLSDYYYRNQTRYRRFDESKASRIEKLLKIAKEPIIKHSPSVPIGGKSTHPGLFIAIVAGILILCFYMIFRGFSFSSEAEKSPVQEKVIQENRPQEQSVEEIANVLLPSDLTGLFFVPKADGISAKGVTARISEVGNGKYDIAVYSDMPIRHYSMILDRGNGLFHSEELGDGTITYDEQTRTITINFSDIWILTN